AGGVDHPAANACILLREGWNRQQACGREGSRPKRISSHRNVPRAGGVMGKSADALGFWPPGRKIPQRFPRRTSSNLTSYRCEQTEITSVHTAEIICEIE